MLKLLAALLFAIANISAFCQVQADSSGESVIAVGEATIEQQRMVILPFEERGKLKSQIKEKAQELFTLMRNDFSFYRHRYEVLDIQDKGDFYTSPSIEAWKSKNYHYVIVTRISSTDDDKVFEARVRGYNITESKSFWEKTYNISLSRLRTIGHEITTDLYQAINQKEPIFKSQIVFVSDQSSKGRRIEKELYIMDFDGHQVRALTSHKGTVISPALSLDRKKVLYSLIENTRQLKKRNIDLYVLDIASGKSEKISTKAGINSGAIFSVDSNFIYLTLSYTGNADIYKMDLRTKELTKVTQHSADDVDPSITRDGTLMTFLSNRSGKAMVYTLDPRGVEKDVKRISYVGQFNAAPRFSPNGTEIVFSSWVDNAFDIYRIDSQGNNISRLTKDFGSNEEASFSSDGEFILFTSQRVLSSKKAIQDIYIMNRDGEIIGRVTQNFGNCSAPKWSI